MNWDRRTGTLVLLTVMMILVATATTAWARAGGGQSFGGSGGGGGGGGGEGFGIIIYWLVNLAIRQPAIGIPLIIVALVIFYISSRKVKKGHETRTITRATRLNREQEMSRRDEMLAALVSRDPGFTEQGFLQRTNRAFLAIQDAWSAHEMHRVRHFVSDGVSERFGIQIDMQRAEGIRNVLEDASILSSRVVGVTSDRNYDTIHVEVTARGRDVDLSLETGRKVRTNTEAPFTEYWSFLRKPGVKTLTEGGLVEGFCPNCGAHMELSDTGRCENCDSVVTSGQYDWVLTEITQSMEWGTLSRPELIPGYEAMVQTDPAFNIQHVEDKVSVVFWRLVRAWFDGNPDAARKVLFPDYLGTLQLQMDNVRQEDWWLYFRDAALGAVEIQRVLPSPEGGMDEVEVLVRWSARNALRNRAGRTRGESEKTIRPQVYVMARKHGVRTDAQMSFMSSHCPACAAPYTGGDTGSCDYCGRPLNDGSQDWALMDIRRFDASRITSEAVEGIHRAALVPPDLVLAAMVSAMYADGEVDGKEMGALASFARSRNIPDEHLQQIIASVASGQGDLPAPEDESQAREVLAAMARMILADGKVTREEAALLTSFGESTGLAAADVRMILTEQRKLLYRQARTTIREIG